jgi:hypothetical protein
MPTVDGFVKLHWSLFRSGYGKLLGPQAGWLLCALATRADKDGKCHPSNELLSKETGMSISTIVAAKKELRRLGFVKYEVVRKLLRPNDPDPRKRFLNIQYYTVLPLKPPKPIEEVIQQDNSELGTVLQSLNYLMGEHPNVASFLQANLEELKSMKIMKRSLEWAASNGVEESKVKLYYAISTVHNLLKNAAKIDRPIAIPIMDPQGLSRLIKLVGILMAASDKHGRLYEESISDFVCWLEDKKRNKTLNLGILPLLADEWVRSGRSRDPE